MALFGRKPSWIIYPADSSILPIRMLDKSGIHKISELIRQLNGCMCEILTVQIYQHVRFIGDQQINENIVIDIPFVPELISYFHYVKTIKIKGARCNEIKDFKFPDNVILEELVILDDSIPWTHKPNSIYAIIKNKIPDIGEELIAESINISFDSNPFLLTEFLQKFAEIKSLCLCASKLEMLDEKKFEKMNISRILVVGSDKEINIDMVLNNTNIRKIILSGDTKFHGNIDERPHLLELSVSSISSFNGYTFRDLDEYIREKIGQNSIDHFESRFKKTKVAIRVD